MERKKRQLKVRFCPNCGYSEREQLYLDGFELFWKIYPRKTGIGLAERVWSKIKPDFELSARIIEAVEIQKKSDNWTKNNGAYIPHPSTWLNQRRWEDETVKVREELKFNPDKVIQKERELEQIREREWQRIHGGL